MFFTTVFKKWWLFYFNSCNISYKYNKEKNTLKKITPYLLLWQNRKKGTPEIVSLVAHFLESQLQVFIFRDLNKNNMYVHCIFFKTKIFVSEAKHTSNSRTGFLNRERGRISTLQLWFVSTLPTCWGETIITGIFSSLIRSHITHHFYNKRLQSKLYRVDAQYKNWHCRFRPLQRAIQFVECFDWLKRFNKTISSSLCGSTTSKYFSTKQ